MKKKSYVYLGPREEFFDRKKAQTFGLALEKLTAGKKKAQLKAAEVIEAARVKTSPLHDYFEWDDSKAGPRWRIEQAKELIRHMAVEIVRGGEKTYERAFMSISVEERSARGKRMHIYVKSVPTEGSESRPRPRDVVFDDWLELQVRSFMRENLTFDGTAYRIDPEMAIELCRLVLKAIGIRIEAKASIENVANA